MSGYSTIYQDFLSCFLIDIIKINSPRQITYHMQADLKEKKKDTWELENELLGYLGPESRMTFESQDVYAFST